MHQLENRIFIFHEELVVVADFFEWHSTALKVWVDTTRREWICWKRQQEHWNWKCRRKDWRQASQRQIYSYTDRVLVGGCGSGCFWSNLDPVLLIWPNLCFYRRYDKVSQIYWVFFRVGSGFQNLFGNQIQLIFTRTTAQVLKVYFCKRLE